jgi:hypothetical protein
MDRSRLRLALALVLLGCAPEPGKEASSIQPGAALIVERSGGPVDCAAKTPAGATSLVPSAAQWLIHTKPRELLRSAIWEPLAAELASDPEWIDIEQMFADCNTPLDGIEQLEVGLDERGEFVAVIAGPRIGQPDTARCLIMAIQVAADEPPVAEVVPWVADPDVSVINFSDGRAYLFGADVLALVTTSWQDQVGELGRCRGVPAIDGFVIQLARVDLDAPVWAVGRLAPEHAAMLPLFLGEAGSRVSAVAASLHLDEGLRLDLDAWTDSPNSATKIATTLRALLDSFGDAEILARVMVGHSGPTVQVRASVSPAELRELLSDGDPP